MNSLDDDGFDPEEIEALEKIMDAIMAEEATGYQMVFWISVVGANEMIEAYTRYLKGSVQDGELCLQEFGKIVSQLKKVIENEQDN